MTPLIFSFWEYTFKCLVLYAILGVIWYVADRKVGVHVYRWAYDLFHRNPMPKSEERGFMYNQRMNRKATLAFLISTVQSAYMLFGAPQIDLLVELVMWILEVPAMLVGFWVGAWFYQYVVLPRRQIFDRVDEVTDKLEHVHVKDVRQGAEKLGGRLFDFFARLPAMLTSRSARTVKSPVLRETPPPAVHDAVPTAQSEEQPPQADSQEALRKYIRR